MTDPSQKIEVLHSRNGYIYFVFNYSLDETGTGSDAALAIPRDPLVSKRIGLRLTTANDDTIWADGRLQQCPKDWPHDESLTELEMMAWVEAQYTSVLTPHLVALRKEREYTGVAWDGTDWSDRP